MLICRLPHGGLLSVFLVLGLCGCASEAASHPLDKELARASIQKAMQAWVDGKTPEELKPEIVVGDQAWAKGKKLISFEIVASEETSDGSNLHIPVKQKFESSESEVTYIVGTSPVITIFPQ
jgi:hypothetical protein